MVVPRGASHEPRTRRLTLDDEVRAAIAASSLAPLSQVVVRRLLVGATTRLIPARATIRPEADDAAHLDLVVTGLIRVHVSAADGRTMTVRYCRSGAIFGAATLYARPGGVFGIQALADSRLLVLRPDVVRPLADRDLTLAHALLQETSERVMSFVEELSGQAFSRVPERIARHLLDLASDDTRPGMLVAEISQQQLADAVGTAREVVVRTLRELREEGIVETGRDGVRIRDPERLAARGSGWNQSP